MSRKRSIPIQTARSSSTDSPCLIIGVGLNCANRQTVPPSTCREHFLQEDSSQHPDVEQWFSKCIAGNLWRFPQKFVRDSLLRRDKEWQRSFAERQLALTSPLNTQRQGGCCVLDTLFIHMKATERTSGAGHHPEEYCVPAL